MLGREPRGPIFPFHDRPDRAVIERSRKPHTLGRPKIYGHGFVIMGVGVNEHLSKQFDAELESIRSRVLEMGGLVESQIRRALDGFGSGERALLDDVIATDRRVNEMEVALDGECSHVIVKREYSGGRLTRTADVRHAAEVVISMLRRALDAFARLDCDAAMEVIRQDASIDSEFQSILRQLVTYMMEDPRTITTALDVIWVAKAIERMGDHAKNMAEYVIYIVKGTDVRHISSREAAALAR